MAWAEYRYLRVEYPSHRPLFQEESYFRTGRFWGVLVNQILSPYGMEGHKFSPPKVLIIVYGHRRYRRVSFK